MGDKANSGGGESGIILSVVVPMYNESEGIDRFLEAVVPVVTGIAAERGKAWEIVCVDDGSADDTLERLVAHHKDNPSVKVVALSRNFGKDIALTAGLEYSSGATVVPIDADLQDPPEVIPELFAKWREGYDVVYAVRKSRRTDSVAKRITAGWFYRIFNRIAETRIPANAGDFRLLDRRVVEAVLRLPERNRFMKLMFAWVGFRQAMVEYDRAPRETGESKWNYWRLWNFALDGITASSTAPLRIWSYIGLVISLAAFAYAGFLVVSTLLYGNDVPGYTSLMVTMLFLGGLNMMTLGVIGEYLGRIFTEVKGRPLYVVDRTFGLDPDEPEKSAWNERSASEWRHSGIGAGGS